MKKELGRVQKHQKSINFYAVFALGASLIASAGSVSANQLSCSFTFDPQELYRQPYGNYEKIELEGCILPEDTPGTPWLPAKFVNILLPSGATVISVEAIPQEILVASDILACPAQPSSPLSGATAPFVAADASVYALNSIYPAVSARSERLQTMRDHTFVSVRLNPVRYIPAQKKLYVAQSIEVRVTYQVSMYSAAPASPPSLGNDIFSEIVSDLVVNPQDMDAFSGVHMYADATADQPAGTVDYLIITSAALSNSFQVLANHRASFNQLTARVLTTPYIAANYNGTRPSGGTDLQTKIRNCIKAYVQQYGTAYVVLGGDDTVVPDRDCYVSCGGYVESQMPCDLYYSGLNGTWDENANGVYGEATSEGDMAFDVIVARIPVQTSAQASQYVNKLMNFEHAPLPSGFVNKMLICGTALWNTYTGSSRPSDALTDGYSGFQSHSPVSDGEIWGRRMFRDIIQPNWQPTLRYYTDSLTSWDGGTPGAYAQSAANVVTRFNEGWNNLFFATHGGSDCWGLESGYFSTSSAATLTNMTAVAYTIACNTAQFDGYDPCLSESFLRNPTGGALVYMGCSRYGWGSPGSYRGGTSFEYAYEFYRQFLVNRRAMVGQAFAYHKAARLANSTYNGADRWVQFGMNLQGDPLVCITATNRMQPIRLTAVSLTNSVVLRWAAPTSLGMPSDTVYIRHRTDRFPTTASDGTEVYVGAAQTFEHTGRNSSGTVTNYYTIWGNDGNPYSTFSGTVNASACVDLGPVRILWQNTGNGTAYFWAMKATWTNNDTIKASGSISEYTLKGWAIIATQDFDGDGVSDILWQNTNSGSVFYWLLDKDYQVKTQGYSCSYTLQGWDVKSVTDFNGDGTPDVLWQNRTSGVVFYWVMKAGTAWANNDTIASSGYGCNYALQGWDVKAVTDFNGDGTPDVLWQNRSSGVVFYWLMKAGSSWVNNSTIASAGNCCNYTLQGWDVKSVTDFNGDGTPDVLWQNRTSGVVFYWLMKAGSSWVNNSTIASSGYCCNYALQGWDVKAVLDK